MPIQPPKFHWLKYLLWVGCFLVIISLSRSVYEIWRKQDVVHERKDELSRLEAENNQLKAELQEAQTPEFVEREARNRLGWGKPGETVVLLENLGVASPGGAAQQSFVRNWKLWWRLFFD